MMNTTAPLAHRYIIVDNEDGTFSVRDLEATTLGTKYLEDGNGNEDLSYRDAYDLRQEYIWS